MSTARTDRNLLFGILALQNNFVDRRALLSAFDAWVLDKTQSLGDVLLKDKALDRHEYELLGALVERHLARHGGDAQQSLAAVSALGSVRQQLEAVADAEVQASLIHVSAAAPPDDPYRTQPFSVGASTSSGQRFCILRPHARGGLGEVLVARDEELHREVALKQIQDRHADSSQSRARLILEAEITGGLEHPGIVPVYGLGAYADGRPYYAMRFIKGESLSEAIGKYHAADKPGRDPGQRTLELRGLLGRFVAVCNAIAYAHGRGVLHRDLKPANIMLGKYGQTLVVDWGLAKSLGPESTSDPDEVALVPSLGDPTDTMMGSVVGTPAYMSPEQAAGQHDRIGPASDIYSLGATLFALLSGQAPFFGTGGEVLEFVRQGTFPAPRMVNAKAPAALEAICLKAMALKPENRYRSPRALAHDIECWLADEPIDVYREPAARRLERWMRRHRTTVNVAAAVLLGIVLVGGVWTWNEARQDDATRLLVQQALREGREAQQAGKLTAALERFASAVASAQARPRLAAMAADASHQSALANADLGDWDRAWTDLQSVQDFNPQDHGAYNSCGALLYSQALSPRDEYGPERRLELLARSIEQFEHCRKLSPEFIGALNNLGHAHRERAVLWHGLGRPEDARAEESRAIAHYSEAIRLNPGERRGWIDRGVTHAKRGDFAAAFEDLQAALKLNTGDAEAILELAAVWLEQGRADRAKDVVAAASHLHNAEAQYNRAVGLQPAAYRAYLGRAAARYELFQLSDRHAEVPKKLGGPEAIKGDLDKAEALGEGLLSTDERAELHQQRGVVLDELKQSRQALVDYDHALRLRAERPSLRLRRGWALVFASAEAKQDFEAALAQRQQLDAFETADAHNGRGYMRALDGNDHDAVLDAEAAVRLTPDTKEVLFNAAAIYGLATGVARIERDDADLAERYATRTLELIRDALAAGSMKDAVRGDRSFVHLRGQPEFQRLIE